LQFGVLDRVYTDPKPNTMEYLFLSAAIGTVIRFKTALFSRSFASTSSRGQTSTCMPFSTWTAPKTPPLRPVSSTRYSRPMAPPRMARMSLFVLRSIADSRPGLTKPELPRKTSTSDIDHVTASRGSMRSLLR